jgi:hypothetical protein
MANRIYTLNPKILLAADEGPIYDAMLEHSALLKGAATLSTKELLDLIEHAGEVGIDDEEKAARAHEVYEGMHRVLTYAFAVGASFAFSQIAKATGGGSLNHMRSRRDS